MLNARDPRAGLLVLLASSLVLASACSSGNSTTSGSNSDGGSTAEAGSDAGPLSESGAPLSAPLDYTFDGVPTTFGTVSMLAPTGWTSKSTATELTLTAASGTSAIDILAPRAAATGEAAQRAQLLAVLNAAFTGHVLTDPAGNATPSQGLTRGSAPQGYTFVGFDLLIDQGKLETHAYLAVFGNVAVPFATIWDPTTGGGYFKSIAGEAAESQLLHTLSLAGATPDTSLPASMIGDFTLGDTSVVELYTFMADGSFIFTLREDFTGSSATTSQSSGTWSLAKDVISFFPTTIGGPLTTTPSSQYLRVYQQSDASAAGGWDTYLCLLGAGDPKTTPIESCFMK